MKKHIVTFMVIVTLAITFLVLYQLWFDERNWEILVKAVISYVVITISLYLTIRYLDLVEGELDNSSNKKPSK